MNNPKTASFSYCFHKLCYNKFVKKFHLPLFLLIPSLLTSCYYASYPCNVFIDSNYNLRVIQYKDNDEYLAVDEYYYYDDKYDGEINIDITVPESINGLPIKHFGRQASMEILTNKGDEHTKYVHDRDEGQTLGPLNLINFCLIGFSYFAEDTVFNINIDIQCDLLNFEFFIGPQIYFYNNNDYLINPKYQIFNCNLNISITENSSIYYSKDGEVYEKNNDGEDKKLTTKRCEIYVNGNLNEYYTG